MAEFFIGLGGESRNDIIDCRQASLLHAEVEVVIKDTTEIAIHVVIGVTIADGTRPYDWKNILHEVKTFAIDHPIQDGPFEGIQIDHSSNMVGKAD